MRIPGPAPPSGPPAGVNWLACESALRPGSSDGLSLGSSVMPRPIAQSLYSMSLAGAPGRRQNREPLGPRSNPPTPALGQYFPGSSGRTGGGTRKRTGIGTRTRVRNGMRKAPPHDEHNRGGAYPSQPASRSAPGLSAVRLDGAPEPAARVRRNMPFPDRAIRPLPSVPP